MLEVYENPCKGKPRLQQKENHAGSESRVWRKLLQPEHHCRKERGDWRKIQSCLTQNANSPGLCIAGAGFKTPLMWFIEDKQASGVRNWRENVAKVKGAVLCFSGWLWGNQPQIPSVRWIRWSEENPDSVVVASHRSRDGQLECS